MRRTQAPANGAGPGLRRASDHAWRLLLVAAAVYVGYRVVMRFEAVVIALFLACVLTALLRPPANVLARFLPRSLAVAAAVLGWLGLLAGIVYLTAARVTSEAPYLGSEFSGGVQRVETWLEGPPFHVRPSTLTGTQDKATAYLKAHRGALLSYALSDVSKLAEVLTILALAVFCGVYFTHSGDRMWAWFQGRLPAGVRPTWRRCGDAAWRTFAGYTRGVILIAAVNAAMVSIALAVLHVPLVLPLVLLEFFLSFVPLVGSPIALAVATLVALASRGVTTAVVVLVLIVVLGQIEGHVLQPFVMGWSVRLHPVAVAVSVIGGTIAAGPIGAVLAVPFVSICWAVYGEARGATAGSAETGRMAADPPGNGLGPRDRKGAAEMPEGANGVTELRREHEEIEALAARVAALGPCPEREGLVREVATRFLSHARAEQRYLYPAFRRFLPGGPEQAVLQTRHDDAAAQIALSIERAGEDADSYEALVGRLVVDIERHIEQQETVLLPTLLDSCSEAEINQLGRQLRSGLHDERDHRDGPETR